MRLAGAAANTCGPRLIVPTTVATKMIFVIITVPFGWRAKPPLGCINERLARLRQATTAATCRGKSICFAYCAIGMFYLPIRSNAGSRRSICASPISRHTVARLIREDAQIQALLAHSDAPRVGGLLAPMRRAA